MGTCPECGRKIECLLCCTAEDNTYYFDGMDFTVHERHAADKRWEEFKRRYFEELEGEQHLIAELLRLEREHGTVTLLFSAKDAQHNNAVALREYLEGVVSRRS